ncbi:MAG: glycosyltransferase family 4 protein [Candidatus Sumerlaeaceae bacterium]|nr:glycosyltransferase family 4 protein [Candidatus Sumerlaeaceae bacterium]
MPPVKVLHITPSVRLLGARRSLLTLVCELAGTRYEPVVLAPGPGALTEELDKRRLRWISLRLPPWRKFGSWFSLPGRVAELREICDRENIGLIHCNEIYPNPHALVASSTGKFGLELPNTLLNQRLIYALKRPVVTHMRLSVTPRMIKNYMLSGATRIIAVSEAAARDFDSFEWKRERVRVVHNGINFEEFEEARQHRHLTRHKLGYEDRDFVIGQIGLLMPRKRPKFLIEAAEIILRLVPHAKFLLVGEPSPTDAGYLDELKSLAKEKRVDFAFQFIPFQQRVAEYFAALDLHVLLSNDEGFGRVVIEAAGAGVPTIGSNVGGIPELIRDDETGFIIGPPDTSDEDFWDELPDFAEMVARLANDREKLGQLGEAAHDFTKRNFSPEGYAAGVSAVFDEAVAECASELESLR